MPRVPPASPTSERSILRQVMDHRPEIRKAWADLDLAVRFGPSLPAELKEEVRRTLAHKGGCVYCASLGPPSGRHADRRIALAVGLATAAVEDFRGVNDDMRSVLRETFSEPELVELYGWICLVVLASQLFGGFTKLEPASSEEIASYEGWWQGQGVAALKGVASPVQAAPSRAKFGAT